MGIVKSNVINNFINRVVTPAYNTCVFWDASNPGTTRMNTSQLAGRDVTRPTTTNIPGNVLAALQIRDMTNAYAVNTTVYRRARSGMNATDINLVASVIDDRTDVCRLLDTYAVTYATADGAILAGEVVHLGNENSYFIAVRAAYDDAQLNAAVVDLRVCHSSCHTNCHSSRGRR